MTYTVIGAPQSRTQRVLWCLEELGQEYTLVPAAAQSEEIRQINPSGKIPALIDGEDTILDSMAICQHLADKHDRLTFSHNTIERTHMQSWIYFANDELESPLWTWWKHAKVRPPKMQVPAVLPICEIEFSRGMKIFEKRLGENEFVMGADFTIPDILITHCANWAEIGCGFSLPDGKVSEYIARMRARPAYERAFAVSA